MITEGLKATEAECAAGRTAPRVSLDDIQRNIAQEYFFVAGHALQLLGAPATPPDSSLNLLTIYLAVLRNGFVVIGKSAPASAANFDAEFGKKLAKEDAIRQMWPLMGYALRDRLAEAPENPIPEGFRGMDNADPA